MIERGHCHLWPKTNFLDTMVYMDEQKNREIKKTRKKLKKSNCEKKPIKIFKKPAGSIRFYKPKTEKTNRTGPKLKKTEPNQKTEPKPSQTGLNRFLSLKNRTETGRFEPVSVFFLNFGLVIFFDKNRIEQKMITPNDIYNEMRPFHSS